MGSRIFISYRREDSRGEAGRIYDQLVAHFGRDRIFMDVDAIQPGLDFVDAIHSAVNETDVQLVMIGPDWLESKNRLGERRLDNPEDFVRIEVASALKRNIRVIPILIDNVMMPRSTDLPDDLKLLSRRNALEISHTRFHSDAQRLISVLELALEQADAERLAAEKAEAERVAAEKAEADRLAAEKAEAERVAAEKAEADRLAAEKAEAERVAAEKAEANRLAAEKAEAERVAAEKAEAERLAAEKAEADRLAADRLVADRLVAEKAEANRLAAEKAETERKAAEKAEAERIAAEKAEEKRLAAEISRAEVLDNEQVVEENRNAQEINLPEQDIEDSLVEDQVHSAEKLETDGTALVNPLASLKLIENKKTDVICPKCGTKNSGDSVNCIKCRINLKMALEYAEKSEAERIVIEKEGRKQVDQVSPYISKRLIMYLSGLQRKVWYLGGIIGLIFILVVAFSSWNQIENKILIRNKLALPIRIYIDLEYRGIVSSMGEEYFSMEEFPADLRWKIDKQINSNGDQIGDDMIGYISNVKPEGIYNVTNIIGDTPYFYPVIDNNSVYDCSIVINKGWKPENDPDAVVSAGRTNVGIGYYELYSNSNIYLDCDGRPIWFGIQPENGGDSFDNLVEDSSGRIVFTIKR